MANSSHDVLALAELLLEPGSLHLYLPGGANEMEKGLLTLEAAAPSITAGRPFAGKPRAGFLAVDIDADSADEGKRLANLCMNAMDMEGEGPTLLVDSGGGPGRFHLWHYMAPWSAEARSQSKTRKHPLVSYLENRPGIDLRDKIRPPLSAHRRGGRSELLNTDPVSAIAELRRLHEPGSGSQSSLDTFVQQHEARLQEYLSLAKAPSRLRYPGGRPDRSAIDAGLALFLWNHRRPYGDLWELRRRFPNGKHVDFPSLTAYDGYLRDKYESAQRKEPAWGKLGVAVALRELEDHLRLGGFRGQSGPSDRLLLAALVGKAQTLGSLRFPISARELAKLTGLSTSTVSAALKRNPWVRVESVDWRTGTPAMVELDPERCARNEQSSPYPPARRDCSDLAHRVPGPDHPVFRPEGLGRAAWPVLQALSDGRPWRVSDLWPQTGLSRRTVQRVLASLRDAATVEQDGQKRYLLVETDWDRLAEALGAAAAAAAARQRHTRDQARFMRGRLLHQWQRAGIDAEPPVEVGNDGQCSRYVTTDGRIVPHKDLEDVLREAAGLASQTPFRSQVSPSMGSAGPVMA